MYILLLSYLYLLRLLMYPVIRSALSSSWYLLTCPIGELFSGKYGRLYKQVRSAALHLVVESIKEYNHLVAIFRKEHVPIEVVPLDNNFH